MVTAKIFKNGRSQAVRLPKEYRFSVGTVCIAKLGDVVMLYPPGKGWEVMQQGIRDFTDDFMSSRDQPTRHQRRRKL